ncbi:MAG: tRNA (adenosine(37)-N6)-dimethylallyltransferase MiaA [Bacteroidetes bacterium]|nr:MAG: tRNA (adenosine(37)-N6)-dimethylallyltransferase MiaA [Bacteroidota bacterium]
MTTSTVKKKEEATTTTKRLLLLGGPTGIGKTAFAIQLAQKLQTEIINADSRQFYREMRIGTARPTEDELAQAPHHFVAQLSVETPYTVVDFENDALAKLEQLFEKHDTVIATGGSGLFLEALAYGLDPLPEADPKLRAELEAQLEQEGVDALAERLRGINPSKAESIDLKNPRRLIRAIEISLAGDAKPSLKKPRVFEVQAYYLNTDRELLYNRINQRVELMMEAGLLEEVKSLLNHRNLNALSTVGYKELFDYLDTKLSLEEAVEQIKQHSRNYAKRQLTWFRNRGNYQEITPGDKSLALVLQNLQ